MQNLIFVILTILVMTIFVGYILIYIRKHSENFNSRKLAVVVLVLTMMGSMLNSLNYYFATAQSFFNTIAAVNLSMLTMSVAIVYLLWVSTRQSVNSLTPRMSIGFALLLAWNEISMGAFLYTIAYSPLERLAIAGTSGALGFAVAGVNSFLFVIPMVSEMAFILLYFKEKRLTKLVFLSLLFMAAFSPSMLQNRLFNLYATVAFTAAMVISMIAIFEYIANRRKTIRAGEMRQLGRLFAIFGIMSFGVFFGDLFSRPFYVAWVPYGAGMVAGMVFYFYTALHQEEPGKMSGWEKHPGFMFNALFLSFISELFVSASILYLSASGGAQGVDSFVAFSALLRGVDSSTPAAIAIDIPYLVGAVANSYVFLTVMGVEMGALVLLRMQKLQWKEKRINLALALIAFGAYTVLWPNFGPESYYSKLPIWANAGALGPMYPGIIIALVGSYAIYAILALLFGRRSYCSTLCPSAVMYGGTLGQAMISYNYGSEISKRNIGSTFKAAIYPFITSSWILMLVLSYLSYSTASGIHDFSIYGIDPIVFFSFFTWNFLWYLLFVSIPFIGMSPCRRYGWCTTGTFVGFFSKLGLFKLKVRDPQTCVTCPTKDCVQACEVGLGDLPGQFIKRGYFKSSKCVGAGSCVQACPYDNIFFYDVRNLIKERRK